MGTHTEQDYFPCTRPHQHPGRRQLTCGAAQLPRVSCRVPLRGLKTQEEFCSNPWDVVLSSLPLLTQQMGGRVGVIFVSRSDLNLFFLYCRITPSHSPQLFFRFGFQLLVEDSSIILSFCPLQPRAESFVLNRMALFFIFCLTLFFFTPSIISPLHS